MKLDEFKTRIRGAINILRGNPTAYKLKIGGDAMLTIDGRRGFIANVDINAPSEQYLKHMERDI